MRLRTSRLALRLRGLALTAALLGAAIVAPPAHAATIVGRSVEYLADSAELVVQAHVVDVRFEFDDAGTLWTRNTLEVSRYLKGSGERRIDVLQVGGVRPDGAVVKLFGDMEVRKGDEIVLFLTRGASGDLHSTLLSWSVFLVDGKGDTATLRRGAGDMGVMTEDGVGRVVPAGVDTFSPPSTVAELAKRIGGAK